MYSNCSPPGYMAASLTQLSRIMTQETTHHHTVNIKYQWSLSDHSKRSSGLTQHNPTHLSRGTILCLQNTIWTLRNATANTAINMIKMFQIFFQPAMGRSTKHFQSDSFPSSPNIIDENAAWPLNGHQKFETSIEAIEKLPVLDMQLLYIIPEDLDPHRTGWWLPHIIILWNYAYSLWAP